MRSLLNILLSVLLLSGCTPAFNFSVTDVTPSKHKINAEINYITCSRTDDTDTPKINIELPEETTPEIYEKICKNTPLTIHWIVALNDALKRSELFKKSAEKKLAIFVKILKIDIPLFALTVTTHVLADYKVMDQATNTVIYNDTVKSEAIIPWNYHFIGYKRGLESINRAVQKNISIFISNLQNSLEI